MNRITMRDIVELSKFLNVPLKEKIMIPENDNTFTMKKGTRWYIECLLFGTFPSNARINERFTIC